MRHFFISLLIPICTLCILPTTFVIAVSPSQWQDGIAISGPTESCALPDQASSSTNIGVTNAAWVIQEDTRPYNSNKTSSTSFSPSRWFLSCWNNNGSLATMLWHGETENMTLIPLSQEEIASNLITAMVQPQPTSANPSFASWLYLFTANPMTSLFGLDLVTYDLTKIEVPLPPDVIHPFTLLEVNGTLIVAQTNTVQVFLPNETSLTLFLYNLNTLTWTNVTANASACANFTAMTYDSISETFTAVCTNALYSCVLPLNNPAITPSLTCQEWANAQDPSQSFNSIYYLRAGNLLFTAQNDPSLVNLFIISSNNVTNTTNFEIASYLLGIEETTGICNTISTTLLADPQAADYLGIIAGYLRPGALQWNNARQALYIGCSSGSAAAVSIQAVEASYPTNPTVTSLISVDICSQTQSSIGIGMSSIFLQCSEGAFSTSGRSLNSISRLPNLNNLFFQNPYTHTSYIVVNIEVGWPESIIMYSVKGTKVSSVSIWKNSMRYAPASVAIANDQRTWLVVTLIDLDFPPCVQLYFMNDAGDTLEQQWPTVPCLFSLNSTASLSVVQSQLRQNVYWTTLGWYLLASPQILYWPGINNINTSSPDPNPPPFPAPIPVVMASNQKQLNVNYTTLQMSELTDGTMIVACDIPIPQDAGDPISTAQYTVYHITIDDPSSHPEQWTISSIIWSRNFSLNSKQQDSTFLVEEDRARVWILNQGQSIVCLNLTTVSVSSMYELDLNMLISSFTLDAVRHRIFVASIPITSSSRLVLMQMHVIDTDLGVMTQTVSPSNAAMPFIIAMLVDPFTGTVTSILQSDSQTSQIVVYSDQWTCSAGMQWIDGSCQVCGMSTSRGFISYENATLITPQCQSCVAGRYSNSTGDSECRACEPGRYSTATGAIMCNYCQANSYNNINGSTQECRYCPSGSEALGIGCTVCSPCELGYSTSYSEDGPGPCEQCPVNSYSPAVGAQCESCTEGGDQEGLSCFGGLASVKEGWWAYHSYNRHDTSFSTTQCPPNYCPGGILQPTYGMFVTFCQYPRLNSSDNWLCADCVSDHIPWGSSCEPCKHANVGLLIGVIILAILLVFFLLRASSAAGPVTILVFFIQVAALELGPVSKWIDWIQFANFGAHSVRSCLLPITPIQQNILTMFVPLMLFVILGLLCCINYCLSIYFLHRDTSHSNRLTRTFDGLTRDFSIDRYIGCSMAILIFCYTSVTVTCVQSLHCVNVAPDINRLFSAPTIDCNSHEYKTQLLPVAILILIVYVIGFPFAMSFFLWCSSSQIRQLSRHREDVGLGVGTDLTRFSARWSHFYRPYRSEVWYWQPIAMLRRLVFALISVLFIQIPTQKYLTYGAFGLFTLAFHTLLHPFIESSSNRLESASYLLLIYIAYLLTSASTPFSVSIQIMLFLLVVPFSVVLVVLITRSAWMNIQAKRAAGRPDDHKLSFEQPLSPNLSSSLPLPSASLHDPLLHGGASQQLEPYL